jgi:hypothetical protein
MDNKMIVGAVLIDFSAALDVIDNTLFLKKVTCYGFAITCYHMVGELFIQ